MNPSITSFLAIGHVTNDLLRGGVVPGGSALYAALAAAHLGCRARILTSHGRDFVGLPLLEAAGVTVSGGGGPRTTTFENVYAGGTRVQRVHAVAERLELPGEADVVLACPVADEVAPSVLRGGLVGAGLQGWLRAIAPDGSVSRRVLPDLSFLAPCRVVFLSREDVDDAGELAARLVDVVPLVVVTRGAEGAELWQPGGVTHLPAVPAREVDPTGAGDVFAAAFLVALARGHAPVAAGRLAARAGALAVEGECPSALARLVEVPIPYATMNE